VIIPAAPVPPVPVTTIQRAKAPKAEAKE
jgi:hypothetical protein